MGLDRIEKKLDAHIEMDDRRTADGHRARILHCTSVITITSTPPPFVMISWMFMLASPLRSDMCGAAPVPEAAPLISR